MQTISYRVSNYAYQGVYSASTGRWDSHAKGDMCVSIAESTLSLVLVCDKIAGYNTVPKHGG